MRGADVARVARSPPAAAVGRASVSAICAAAGSRAGTPSTMIAAGRFIETRGRPRAFGRVASKVLGAATRGPRPRRPPQPRRRFWSRVAMKRRDASACHVPHRQKQSRTPPAVAALRRREDRAVRYDVRLFVYLRGRVRSGRASRRPELERDTERYGPGAILHGR